MAQEGFATDQPGFNIAAEIESNINRADWDADCYEGCRRLLLRETQRMGAVSDDRGPEEIPVLMDFEVQHWVAEALENATRATELILGRVALMGMHRPNLDQEEAGDLDPTASRATQAVMRAATAYPLSDAQLERKGAGEKGPRCTGRNGRREPSPGDNFGG
jgi:hypothetical protein